MNRSGPQRSSETQLMTVGIAQVEEAFAPLGIMRDGVGLESGGHETGIEHVDVRYVKYWTMISLSQRATSAGSAVGEGRKFAGTVCWNLGEKAIATLLPPPPVS